MQHTIEVASKCLPKKKQTLRSIRWKQVFDKKEIMLKQNECIIECSSLRIHTNIYAYINQQRMSVLLLLRYFFNAGVQ